MDNIMGTTTQLNQGKGFTNIYIRNLIQNTVEAYSPEEFTETSMLCHVLNYHMQPRTEKKNRYSKYMSPGEEKQTRARFLNNLALLSCDDSSNVVAVAVHMLGSQETSTLYVASNMLNTTKDRGALENYINLLRSELTGPLPLQHSKIKAIVYSRTRRPLQKKCRKFFSRPEERLVAERKMLENLLYFSQYEELKAYISKDTPIKDLPIVSQLADAFTSNKMFERFFPSEEPISRRLVKIGAYARALRNLVSCAENEVYRSIFNTINIVYIPPRVVRINLRPMKEALNNVIPQDLLCPETYDIAQRKLRYDRDPVLTQHAELLIAEHLSKTHHHEAYIGISKYSCHLCYQVLQKWPEQKYAVAGTHGKMAAKWLSPASLPNEIISAIKAEMVQKLIDKIDLIQKLLTDSDLDSIDSKAMIQTGRENADLTTVEDIDWALYSHL